MEKEINIVVKECLPCQKYQSQRRKVTLKQIVTYRPWQMIGIDFCDLGYSSKRGFKNILLAVDYFSRWIEVIATKDMTSSTVENFIGQVWQQHGCPERIINDGSPGFISIVLLNSMKY